MWHLILLLLLPVSALAGFAVPHDVAHSKMPYRWSHVIPDPEASGREYLSLFEESEFRLSGKPGNSLDEILDVGRRNHEWLSHLNSFRSEDTKLRISRPGQGKGYPMDAPARYGESTILEDRARLEAGLPPAMYAVLFKGAPFSDQPPVPDAEYVDWARKVDRLYQFTARWILLQPWLGALELRRRNDVRGYWRLRDLPDRDGLLAGFSTLPDEKKREIRGWLLGMCINNFGALDGKCPDRISAAEREGKLVGFYESLVPKSTAVWEEFFELWTERNDVTWKVPELATVPFQHPGSDRVVSFLGHIENEWKWGDWRMRLDFRNDGLDHPRIVFKPGVTPNVNEIGGNIITMDSNASLDEWDVQWTIRHEWGHVLGFPDCYLEFYVPEEEVIYNYQIDLTNLMCSRAGRLQEQHFLRLRDAHYNH